MMNLRFTFLGLFLGGLLPQAMGQTVHVFPKDHANREGYAANTCPLTAGVNRTLFVFDKWGITIPNGGMIQKVGFRQDGFQAVSGKKIQLQIFMGQTIKPLAKLDQNFAAAYTTARQEVYRKKIFSLPTFSVPPKAPSKKMILIPLDKPYKYDSTKNLVLEYVIYANSNGNKKFIYPVDYAGVFSPVSTFGKGCPGSSKKSPFLRMSPVAIGGNLTASLSSAPASSGGLIFYGISKTKLNGSIPLPLSLDFLGAKGCKLFVDIQLPLSFTTNTGGNGTKKLLLPKDTRLYGVEVFTQVLSLDLFANAAGYVTSNGASVKIGAAPPSFMIQTSILSASRGSYYRNNGNIQIFEVK
ncbi:MAG TPA: hypothetical protein ENK02_06125 [Planctomycetes bacterium]|nr:hypothetical protein [Planctomycetota bacterium]